MTYLVLFHRTAVQVIKDHHLDPTAVRILSQEDHAYGANLLAGDSIIASFQELKFSAILHRTLQLLLDRLNQSLPEVRNNVKVTYEP